ncbi:MAG: DUF4405 domain-containing protein [Acidobacteria bacterium]|nr:DUF4405 domain-containing protein [Acidobacteriota bacterium]
MRKKKSFRLRAYVSVFLGFSGLLLLVSGLVLYIAPPGRVAHWVNWRFLAATKEQWIALHTVLSFLFVGIGIWHLVYNWKPFIHYLKEKGRSMFHWKRESAIALVTVLLIAALALLNVPPLSYISELGTMASNAWETPKTKPVMPHAEKLTLKAYARAAKIPLVQIEKRLAALGYRAAETDTLEKIAGKLKVSPMSLAELFARESRFHGERKEGSISDAGVSVAKLSLSEYSGKTGIPVKRFIRRLSINGYTATETDTIGEIAAKMNTSPAALVELFSRPPQSDPFLKKGK